MDTCRFCGAAVVNGYPERLWSDLTLQWDFSGPLVINDSPGKTNYVYTCPRCYPFDNWFSNMLRYCIGIYREQHGCK